MPTRPLPPKPDLDQVRHQAKDLLHAHRAADPQAMQRIREFHPRFRRASDAAIAQAEFALSDAQLAIAREHGYASWPRLKQRIERPTLADRTDLPQHERIEDPRFRRAVDLLDAGDARVLRAHLAAHPGLATERVLLEGGNYFRNPSLLEFIAENPIRRGRLPPNIVEVAEVILDAGAKEDRAAMTETLGLVGSGRVPRECNVQAPLIDVLCDHGADPDGAMGPALAHGEWPAVQALLRRGARLDLPVAAALGRVEEARATLPGADADARHRGLALAAQFGHADIVRLLLDAGEDPSRYNPVGTHSHSTPLHQAALGGHLEVLRLLVERGARMDLRDTIYQGTPLDWARHGKRPEEVAAYLGSLEPSSTTERSP
jgi:ankyrin repeat protein